MQRIAWFATTLVFSASAWSMNPQQREDQYNQYLKQLHQLVQVQTFERQQQFNKMADLAKDSEIKTNLFAKAFSEVLETTPEAPSSWIQLNLNQLPMRMHLALVSSQSSIVRNPALEKKVVAAWNSNDSDIQQSICSYVKSPNKAIQGIFAKYQEIRDNCLSIYTAINPPSLGQIRDLLSNLPDARNFRNGEFYKKPVLFQFCRTHRDQTCLQVMKDGDGRWVRTSSGQIWSQGKLSLSRVGNEFNEFNGDTPAGIYALDGVMPEANGQEVYGRFRRLIMSFIPRSNGEMTIKSLLPRSHHSENWWKEAIIARDMGRDLFRIHGTLRRNDDKSTSYYPFYPTLGCVASKESTYDGVDYIDQRHLLDQLMTQQGLQPIFQNETRIRARFYVIEINGVRGPVTLQDLKAYGVE